MTAAKASRQAELLKAHRVNVVHEAFGERCRLVRHDKQQSCHHEGSHGRALNQQSYRTGIAERAARVRATCASRVAVPAHVPVSTAPARPHF